MSNFNPQKILITFLMHLGDLTLMTPFIRALRNCFPDAELTMLVDQKLADVVRANPCLNHIETIDKKGKDNNLTAVWRKARSLSGRFDTVLNLHPNERCSFLASAVKTQNRCGTAHWLFRPFWDRFTPLDRTRHAAEMYLDVLTRLGFSPIRHNGLETFTLPQWDDEAERFWNEAGLDSGEPLIGFNIGSAVETKRWNPERFAQTADALAAGGYRTVFFGSRSEQPMVDEAAGAMKSKPILATGRFSIGTLIAAIGRCSLFITNDSGPMHLAISQKVPVVALYGPSHTDLYGPYTEQAAVVRADPPCGGCASGMKHHCADGRCMRNLTVDQVLAAARMMLAKYPKPI